LKAIALASPLEFPRPPVSEAIIVAVLFSVGTGVFFGYYLACKAAGLDPVEALRYE